jgi:antitoxin component HigA of HigAB toxin-antitoxin module
MSYRTRIHSVTGFSPFYLMFGREMLSFENWSHETDVNDVLAIENRTNEIKNHFEQTIPSTVEIINKKKREKNKNSKKQRIFWRII